MTSATARVACALARGLAFAPAIALAVSCAHAASTTPAPAPPTPAPAPSATTRHAADGVIDLHVDLPYALHALHTPLPQSQASPRRLAMGGVALVVTPLFVDGARTMRPAAVRAAYAATYADLRAVASQLPAAVAIAFEGVDGFADAPEAIDAWMARGACLVGLVHDRANALGGASQDPDPAGRARGLSAAGEALAARVVAHGGVLDVAHASDATFDGLAVVARAAHAPIVDSHTGMRALRDTMRNIDDGRLRVIADSDGIVGVSMHGGHVGATPGEPPTLEDVAAHIEHAVRIAGATHVALGSDFDGGIAPPAGADGEAVWPRLRALLRARGMSESDAAAIFGGNAARVLGWARGHGCTPGAR